MAFIVERIRRRPGATPPSRVTPAPTVKRPMSRTEIADELAAIKDSARSLRPPLNDKPNQWHEDKSDLVRQIVLLEDAVRGNRLLARE